MVGFIIVFIVVAALVYYGFADENGLDDKSGCILAIIVGVFGALMFLFATMR